MFIVIIKSDAINASMHSYIIIMCADGSSIYVSKSAIDNMCGGYGMYIYAATSVSDKYYILLFVFHNITTLTISILSLK